MKYVYLLRAGDKHYKVGVASSVKKRVASLQTANPNRVEIVTTRLVDDAYALESELHTYLQVLRTTGGQEWFTLDHQQALSLAVRINQSPEIDIAQNIRLRDILSDQTERQKRIEHKLTIVIDLAMSKVERKQEAAAQKEIDLQVREALKIEKPRVEKETDEALIGRAAAVVQAAGKASTSLLQRRLRIGYGRAARVMEEMEERGIIGAADGSRPRKVLVE
jgi:DNA segregation ATPase FtsK/SpoIIIE-like protein